MTNITIMVSREDKRWTMLYDNVTVPSRHEPEHYAELLIRKYTDKFPHSRTYGHTWRKFQVFTLIDSGEFDEQGQAVYPS